MSAPKSSLISQEATPLAVSDFDHVEYYVGNAKQAAYFYRHALGFDVVGYRGPETGVKDRVSYALRQNAIQIVLTAALSGDHPIAEHVKRHGDGVHAVAFLTSDAAADYATAVQRGAQGKMDPTVSHDENGRVTVAEIGAFRTTKTDASRSRKLARTARRFIGLSNARAIAARSCRDLRRCICRRRIRRICTA